MSKIYITSDWHFCHNKPFIYEPRGFSNIDDMNKTIIEHHNSVVTPEDDVYVLGDLVLGDTEKGIKCFNQLNGKFHIVRGNHDTDCRWQLFLQNAKVVEAQNAIYLKYGGYHFYLSHYPTQTSNFDIDKPLKQRLINLCGHSHTQDFWLDWKQHPIIHCEVDVNDCYPIDLDVIAEICQKVEECKEQL